MATLAVKQHTLRGGDVLAFVPANAIKGRGEGEGYALASASRKCSV